VFSVVEAQREFVRPYKILTLPVAPRVPPDSEGAWVGESVRHCGRRSPIHGRISARILSIDEDRRGGPNGQEQLPLRLRVGFRRALRGVIGSFPRLARERWSVVEVGPDSCSNIELADHVHVGIDEAENMWLSDRLRCRPDRHSSPHFARGSMVRSRPS